MVKTQVINAVRNYGDDLFKRATQTRNLGQGVKEVLKKEKRYVTEEVINGEKQIVMYWKDADGTVTRCFSGSKEVYGQNGVIKTGNYMDLNGNGSAVFEYQPNKIIDCNYTLTNKDGDTFSGLLMNKEAGGRHIEELKLGGNRVATTNDGSLGHFFNVFVKSIFGG